MGIFLESNYHIKTPKVLHPDTVGMYLLPNSCKFVIKNNDNITGRSPPLQLAILHTQTSRKPKSQHFLCDTDHFLMILNVIDCEAHMLH